MVFEGFDGPEDCGEAIQSIGGTKEVRMCVGLVV